MTAENRAKHRSRRGAVEQTRCRLDMAAGRVLVLCLVLLAPSGCGGDFDPVPVDQAAFLERKQVQRDGAVTVAAAVPSAGETRQLFGASLFMVRILLSETWGSL